MAQNYSNNNMRNDLNNENNYKSMEMSIKNGFRWFMSVSKWMPSKEEWLLGMSCLQNEEQLRVNRFVFKRDAKLGLIGRLMIRKCAKLSFNSMNYNDLRFGRTERGKPFLIKPFNDSIDSNEENGFDFNISHSGDYCVCASNNWSKIGVDVMKIEYSGGQKRLAEFFRLMDRQFSQTEWNFINSGLNDWEKLSRFIRLWALKESYVKAEGIGISFNLKRISFHCLTPALKVGQITCDSVISVDNKQLNEWLFEESLIDNNHCVSVASIVDKNKSNFSSEDLIFKEMTINDLLEDVIPLYPECDETLWKDFLSKPEKPNQN
jgi:4'-phosphopantetheinyl transferase